MIERLALSRPLTRQRLVGRAVLAAETRLATTEAAIERTAFDVIIPGTEQLHYTQTLQRRWLALPKGAILSDEYQIVGTILQPMQLTTHVYTLDLPELAEVLRFSGHSQAISYADGRPAETDLLSMLQ